MEYAVRFDAILKKLRSRDSNIIPIMNKLRCPDSSGLSQLDYENEK
jgi:hypothetical protein